MEFKMEKNWKLNNALYTEVEMFKLMDCTGIFTSVQFTNVQFVLNGFYVTYKVSNFELHWMLRI